MTRAVRRLIMGAACAALPILMTSCAGAQTSTEESLAAPGVLKCAEFSVYGTVAALETSGPSVSVRFEAARWVTPRAGNSSISFSVDSADESWDVGDVGLLVMKDGSPPLLLDSAQADEVEQSWDGVNNPESEDCNA